MIKKAKILTALFVVLSLWSGNLRAGLITIYLTAEVTEVGDHGDLLEGKVSVGDTITGSYIYDSSTPDTDVLHFDTVGQYQHSSPPYGISLSVGGFTFQTDPDNVNFLIGILDNHNGRDAIGFGSYNNLPLSTGLNVKYISWQLADHTCNALSSAALPTTPPVLEDWESNDLSITFGPKDYPYILARVTSAVPEPATILFLALGSLAFTRRRR